VRVGKTMFALGVLVLFYSIPVFAQVTPALQRVGASEISVDFTGDFPKKTCSGGQIDPCTTGQSVDGNNSGGLLLTYRQNFTRWSAIELNYDYTRFAESYGTGAVTRARVDEVTVAYVLSFRSLTGGHFAPFAEVGLGALIFSPTSSTISGPIPQDRAPLLYGGGFDISDGGHLAVRLGYRGLIFQAPDFAVSSLVTGGISHIAEPYVGIVVRF
jgi:hypothetical protein